MQLLLVAACYYMLEQPLLAGPCYFLSGFLDHFDGSAARRLGQCSQFGATLDMVTDRVATTLLVRATPFPRCLSPKSLVDKNPPQRTDVPGYEQLHPTNSSHFLLSACSLTLALTMYS